MKTKHIFSITEFAKFARTTRAALLHYEEIGLLKPIRRGDNKYRYYSHSQLATVNLIHTCRSLGMPLSDIQDLIEHRTPDLIYELLGRQIKAVDERIAESIRARKLLCILSDTIHAVQDVDETAISIQWVEKQAITLGEQNDYSGNRDDYDALDSFYQSCFYKYPDMDMNYSVWGTFSEERIKRRDWRWPDRYYFNNPDGLEDRPAAFYAVGYTRGGYGQSHDLYVRMLEYIETSGFAISGPTYEEYPLNEICITDDKDYLMRVMITVERNG